MHKLSRGGKHGGSPDARSRSQIIKQGHRLYRLVMLVTGWSEGQQIGGNITWKHDIIHRQKSSKSNLLIWVDKPGWEKTTNIDVPTKKNPPIQDPSLSDDEGMLVSPSRLDYKRIVNDVFLTVLKAHDHQMIFFRRSHCEECRE